MFSARSKLLWIGLCALILVLVLGGLASERVRTAAASGDVTNGLIGYWKMDESSGVTAHDSSGFGYDGTVTAGSGNYNWQPAGGKINGALQIYAGNSTNGSGVTVPSNSQINFTGDFSITLWVKTTSGYQYLVWKTANDLPGTGNAFQGYGFGLGGTVPTSWHIWTARSWEVQIMFPPTNGLTWQ